MATMFMNPENSKISDPHRLLLSLSDKITLKEEINMLLYIYAFTIHEKIFMNFNEFLTPETIKPLGSIKKKITKDENGENMPYLEITEVVLIYCNIVNSDYQQGSWDFYTIVLNKSFGQLPDISPY